MNNVRLIVILDSGVIDMENNTTFNVDNIEHYKFKLIMFYSFNALFHKVLRWTVMYRVNTDNFIIINRFTHELTVTPNEHRLDNWAILCNLFGAQNLSRVILKTIQVSGSETSNHSLLGLLKFVQKRMVY